MNWNDIENSTSDGSPVKLYELIRGDNEATTLYYTNADKNIEFNSTLYNAITISDDGLNKTTDNMLTLTLPDDNPIVTLFQGVPPMSVIRLRIRVLHGSEARLVWAGKIVECRRSKPGSAELVASNIIQTFSQSGPRLTWSRSCPHALYDDFCRVNKQAFKDTGVITALDGESITVALSVMREDGWYNGGFIEWNDNGAQDSRHIIAHGRHIIAHGGQKVSLIGGTSRLTLGISIAIYPGCGRTIGICDSKFNNHLNFGGVPGMPGISPFNGNKVF